MMIRRESNVPSSVTVDTSGNIANCTVISYGDWAGGSVDVPAASSLTTLTWYKCSTRSGTYLPAYDGLGNAVTSAVGASESVPIPNTLFGAQYLKIVGNAAGTVTVSLKA
jgi:hypothetical protein